VSALVSFIAAWIPLSQHKEEFMDSINIKDVVLWAAQFGSLGALLFSAWYWLASARVDVPEWPPTKQGISMGHIARALYVQGKLNGKAATWAFVAAGLTAITYFIGWLTAEP
jgi:hypothetical protein